MAGEPITQDPPAPPLLKTIIPAELHDRGWAKDWLEKPHTPEATAELFKKLDGAEALIGKKTLIPGADVTDPKELEAFYGKLRPAKAEDYEFKLGDKPDEGFVKEMRAAAHAAGLDKRQLAKFVEGLAPGFTARQKAVADAQAAQNAEFEALVEKAHGKDNEAVLARTEAAITEFTPEAYKPFVAGLDNKSLAVLSGVINAVLVKYVPEADLAGMGKGAPSGDGAVTPEALREEAKKLMASPAYTDFRLADHKKTVDRVNEIYAHPLLKG